MPIRSGFEGEDTPMGPTMCYREQANENVVWLYSKKSMLSWGFSVPGQTVSRGDGG